MTFLWYVLFMWCAVTWTWGGMMFVALGVTSRQEGGRKMGPKEFFGLLGLWVLAPLWVPLLFGTTLFKNRAR